MKKDTEKDGTGILHSSGINKFTSGFLRELCSSVLSYLYSVCRPLLVFFIRFLWTTVLYFLLTFTASEYHFCIFELLLQKICFILFICTIIFISVIQFVLNHDELFWMFTVFSLPYISLVIEYEFFLGISKTTTSWSD